MNDTNRERVDDFIRSLGEALDGSGSQSTGVLEEVRGDLEAHVERFQAEGHSEGEAVERALGEMGNPYEMGHHLRREIPPFGGKVLTPIRYVAASGVILWTLLLLWYFRGWVYGFSPAFVAIVVLLHLPAILLLWPRIVWRKNWLFGLIPAGLGLIVAMAVSLGGVEAESSTQIAFALESGEHGVVPAPVEEPAGSEPSRTTPVLVAAALGVVALVLLMAMQQHSQRRRAVLAILLVAGGVEAVFQVEEFIFRQDRKRIRDYMDASFRQNGAYPTREALKSEGPGLRSEHARLTVDGGDFSIFWGRPLSSGFSIVYSSEDDRIWIQD